VSDKFSSKLDRTEFFKKIYTKGNSKDSLNVAKNALANLDYYNQDTFNETTDQILQALEREQEDAQLNYLRKFVEWLAVDHENIINKKNRALSKKSESGIRSYLGMARKYLRLVHGIKLDGDDVKDFVTIPKDVVEREPEPLTIQELRNDFSYVKKRFIQFE